MYTHNGILFSHNMNEILPFATASIDLESIMLSKISQRKRNIIWLHSYVDVKKQNSKEKKRYTKNQTLNYREQTDGYQKGGG